MTPPGWGWYPADEALRLMDSFRRRAYLDSLAADGAHVAFEEVRLFFRTLRDAGLIERGGDGEFLLPAEPDGPAWDELRAAVSAALSLGGNAPWR